MATSGHDPGTPGTVTSFGLEPKPITRHFKSDENSKTNVMVLTPSAQDYIGTCGQDPYSSRLIFSSF